MGAFVMPKEHPVAQFRNVSGADLELSLPQWLDRRLVKAGEVVDVDDDLVAAHEQDVPRNYFTPAIWERADAADPAKDDKNGSN